MVVDVDIYKQKVCSCCQGGDSWIACKWTSSLAFGWEGFPCGWWKATSESIKCFDVEDSG